MGEGWRRDWRDRPPRCKSRTAILPTVMYVHPHMCAHCAVFITELVVAWRVTAPSTRMSAGDVQPDGPRDRQSAATNRHEDVRGAVRVRDRHASILQSQRITGRHCWVRGPGGCGI